MAQTITSGILATDGVTIRPQSTLTWADLSSSPYASWENWTSWAAEPANIVVSETIDTGVSDYYTPLADIDVIGDLTVTVDVSETGTFTGEESTITFATDDVGQDLYKGRYIRWNFTVAPTVDEPTPYINYVVQANNSPIDIYMDDVAVPALPTDSLGFRLINHRLGAIKHVQATTLQGDDYVDNGYVLTFDALDSYVRTSADSLITQEGAPYDYVDSFASRMGKAIQWNGVDQALEIDNSGGEILSTYPWTIEFFFKVPPGSFDPQYGAESTLFRSKATGDMQPAISIRVVEGISAEPESKLSVQMRTANQSGGQSHGPFPIEANRWYHYVLTMTDNINYRSTIATVDRLDSGPGPSEGAQDILTGTVGYAQVNSDTIWLGRINVYGDSRDYERAQDVVIDELRISNTQRYSTYDSNTVPIVPYSSDENTTLLMHFNESIEDDNLVRTGTEDYFYRQNGGSAVIEQKNPLALKVVDYNGDAWDGAIDLHLRGIPKVAKIGNQLTIKYD